MYSSVAKFFLALGSIAAGTCAAVYLATSMQKEMANAARVPEPVPVAAVTPEREEPPRFEPPQYVLPEFEPPARREPARYAAPISLTAHTQLLEESAVPKELPPPPPPLNEFVPPPPEENEAPPVPPNFEPVAAPEQKQAAAVEAHPVPRRNFLAPRKPAAATQATTRQPATVPTAPRPGVPFADDPAATPVPEVLPEANVHRGEGDDKLYINVQNTDIREVLQLIGAQGNLNILASKNVTGNVSATLNNVDVQTALSAILRSHGYAARTDGRIIFVGTPADLQTIDQSSDRLTTRVYRPNYANANELQKLITPMLTPNIGKVTISTPAKTDIPADQVQTGGDSFGGNDVVIVRDYEAVLLSVDELVCEVDCRPPQVSIEAMILSVRLQDQYKLGVNFEVLRDRANVRLAQGQPAADLATLTFSPGSLKLGFLDGSLGGLVEALEQVGDTNVIASPKLMVLNKQKAEIQIGEQLGYVNTTVTENASTQSVAFLDVGTLLRLRPFIASDGLIRLEVHPELSTGNVVVQSGLTLPNKSITQVTTNIMCRDGCTVVLGGLIREDLKNDTKQLPFLGNVPWVGPLFRNKTESVDRVELIVLLTPRIVGDAVMNDEGQQLEHEFSARQGTYFAKMSQLGKRHMGEKHYRYARASVTAGDYSSALKQVDLAIHYDPMNREAVMLREQIVAEGGFEDESVGQYLRQGLSPFSHGKDYSKRGYPWKTPPEQGFENLPSEVPDKGVVTPRTFIEPQRPVALPK